MSHPEQLGFFSAVVDANMDLVAGGSVLEIGSYDVNGTVRNIFGAAKRYIGVDLVEGPGVDLVGFGHQLHDPDSSFDLVISGECFEHDPHWAETFATMSRLARPGGLVAFTCASRGRPEHGTNRTLRSDSPGTQAAGLDYYRNLEEHDFRASQAFDLEELFEKHRFWYLPTSFDLYFVGIRKGGSGSGVLPDDAAVAELGSLMAAPHRIVRAPLRAISRRMDDSKYQDIIRPYWSLVERAGRMPLPSSMRRSHRG